MQSAALHPVCVLKGHKARVWNAAWSPNGRILASCGGDKEILLWGEEESAEGPTQWRLKGRLTDTHDRTIRKVEWSPDGKFLVAASFDATTSVWENREGEFEPIAALEGHENEVKGAAFDATGVMLSTCSRDKTVWIWEMDPVSQDFQCLAVLHGHSQDVKSVVWHPSLPLLVSCSYDDTIKFWKEDDDYDWICCDTLKGHESTVWEASFDSTGDKLVSCSDDRSLILWRNTQTDQGKKWLSEHVVAGAHGRTVYSVDWAKGKPVIASGGADDAVRVYGEVQKPDGSYELKLVASRENAHVGDVNCVRWNPKKDGILATAGDDGTVRIWKLHSGV